MFDPNVNPLLLGTVGAAVEDVCPKVKLGVLVVAAVFGAEDPKTGALLES